MASPHERSSKPSVGRTSASSQEVDATDGLLLWVTPTGARREVVQSSLAETAQDSVPCDRCGGNARLETVVREHRRCGYVAFDGMAGPDGMTHTCPKCETTDAAGFPAVATIWTCQTCGHPIDELG